MTSSGKFPFHKNIWYRKNNRGYVFVEKKINFLQVLEKNATAVKTAVVVLFCQVISIIGCTTIYYSGLSEGLHARNVRKINEKKMSKITHEIVCFFVLSLLAN